MKKLWYSKGTKAVAVVLFLLSLTLGLLSLIQGAEQLNKETGYIYDFGNSLEDSYYFTSMLRAPENAVMSVFNSYAYNYRYPSDSKDNTDIVYDSNGKIPMDGTTRAAMNLDMQRTLNNIHYRSKVLYYVNWNGKVFTNGMKVDPTDLCKEKNFRYISFSDNGYLLELDTSQGTSGSVDTYGLQQFSVPGTLVICTAIRPEVVTQSQEVWDRQEQSIYTMGAQLLCCVAVAVLSLVYLLCVCGRNAQAESLSSWVDHIWVEFHLIFLAGFLAGGTLLMAWLADLAFSGSFPMYGVYWAGALCMPLVSGMVLSSLLSVIRNIKNKCFA